MRIPAVAWAWELIRTGKTKFLIAECWMRFYKTVQEWIYALRWQVFGRLPGAGEFDLKLDTKNPIAFESPDHLIPWGTSRDNSTNKKFVTVMRNRIASEHPQTTLGSLDLGCSGGQLVADFRNQGWRSVGLEGSDFSLKHKRANWPALAGKNLFTCDITKPFKLTSRGEPVQFHLVTMWEVLEHIQASDLPQLFANISNHLALGGYFIASTTSETDIHNGIDLHQTKWTNQEWQQWLAKNQPEFEVVDLGLKFYQFVRHNQEGSFLTYRKKS